MEPSRIVKIMVDYEQVQIFSQESTFVLKTYEGEHSHFLSPLYMVVMHGGSSNQLNGEEKNI